MALDLEPLLLAEAALADGEDGGLQGLQEGVVLPVAVFEGGGADGLEGREISLRNLYSG